MGLTRPQRFHKPGRTPSSVGVKVVHYTGQPVEDVIQTFRRVVEETKWKRLRRPTMTIPLDGPLKDTLVVTKGGAIGNESAVLEALVNLHEAIYQRA